MSKRLWGRVGISVTLTDRQYANLIGADHQDEVEGTTHATELLKTFLCNPRVTHFDGDTYFPSSNGVRVADNPEFEMNFDI